MKISRRELRFLLPALAAAGASAQGATLSSKVYGYSALEVRTNANNDNKQRPVFDGATHTGFTVEMHETELAPGMMPHSSHHHLHEEMLILREGSVEVTIEGKTTLLEPGSVAFVASNEEHGWRNVGTTLARYFILTLGRG